MTTVFLILILGATGTRAPAGFAPIAGGLALTLIHPIGIPKPSVNPARSTGRAQSVGGCVIGQLGLFWLAPIAGAVTCHAVAGEAN
jgi:aquaporin Z